jgi:hypothetical protein
LTTERAKTGRGVFRISPINDGDEHGWPRGRQHWEKKKKKLKFLVFARYGDDISGTMYSMMPLMRDLGRTAKLDNQNISPRVDEDR